MAERIILSSSFDKVSEAKKKSASANRLNELASDPSRQVRLAVARNENTTDETLHKMILNEREHQGVLEAIATHTKSGAVLTALSSNEYAYGYIHTLAFLNDNMPAAVLSKIKSISRTKKLAIAENPKTPEKTRSILLLEDPDPYVNAIAAWFPLLPENDVTAYWRMQKAQPLADRNQLALRGLVRGKNVPDSTRNEIFDKGDKHVRFDAVKSGYASYGLLLKASSDPDEFVRGLAKTKLDTLRGLQRQTF